MIALLTAYLFFLKSLCTCEIVSAKVRAKTVFGHLKGLLTYLLGCVAKDVMVK